MSSGHVIVLFVFENSGVTDSVKIHYFSLEFSAVVFAAVTRNSASMEAKATGSSKQGNIGHTVLPNVSLCTVSFY
jgi:hypothetical protein